MYSVCVRDHFMIAHSFRGEAFGPAQRLHGATYVVDVEFRRAGARRGRPGGRHRSRRHALRVVLDALNYRNLDDEPAFAGRNTTTEFLARAVFDRVRVAIGAGQLGETARGLARLKVTLHESHAAWAAFEGEL